MLRNCSTLKMTLTCNNSIEGVRGQNIKKKHTQKKPKTKWKELETGEKKQRQKQDKRKEKGGMKGQAV